MPKEDGYFKQGNQAARGRRQPITFRAAIREELAKSIPGKGNLTKYQEWARKIIEEAEAGGNPAKFEVIKFLEGVTPPDKGIPADELETPEPVDVDGNPI